MKLLGIQNHAVSINGGRSWAEVVYLLKVPVLASETSTQIRII